MIIDKSFKHITSQSIKKEAETATLLKLSGYRVGVVNLTDVWQFTYLAIQIFLKIKTRL